MTTNLLIIYAALCLSIGIMLFTRTRSSAYHTDTHSIGSFGVAAGVFTLIGVGEYATITALVYAFGIQALFLFLGVTAGAFTMAACVKQARRSDKLRDFHSLPDFIHAHFGRFAGSLTSLYTLIVLSCLLLIQIIVGGQIIELISGLPYAHSALLTTGLVFLYVVLGGFRSVMATDKIQALFVIFFSFLWLAFFQQDGEISTSLAQKETDSMPIGLSLLLFVSGFLAMIGGGDVWQRMLLAKDDRAAANGFRLAGIGIFLFGLFVYFLALQIKTLYPEIDPNHAFTTYLAEMPALAGGIIGLVVFSSLLSTADTELFAVSVILHREIQRFRKSEMSVAGTRRIMMVVALMISISALLLTDLVGIYMNLLYLFTILGAVTLPILMGRATKATVLGGLIFGGILLGSLFIMEMTDNSWAMLLIATPLLISLPFCNEKLCNEKH